MPTKQSRFEYKAQDSVAENDNNALGLPEHWQKHGHEFQGSGKEGDDGLRSCNDYLRSAIDFCQAATTRRFYCRFNGRPTIGYYNKDLLIYSATSVDGKTIFTYQCFKYRDNGQRQFDDVLRSSRTPHGKQRQMPPTQDYRNSVPFRRDRET